MSSLVLPRSIPILIFLPSCPFSVSAKELIPKEGLDGTSSDVIYRVAYVLYLHVHFLMNSFV